MAKSQYNALILSEGFISLLLGLVFYFSPDLLLNFIFVDEIDGVAMHLARCLAAQQMAFGLSALIIGRSKSGDAKSTHMTLRIIGFILLAVASQHARQHFLHKYTSVLGILIPSILFYGSITIVLIYAIANVRRQWPFGDTLLYKENTITLIAVQLDGLAALVIGITWFAFPAWLLSRQITVVQSGVHEFLGRLMGCWFVASSQYSFHCIWWKQDSDRNAFSLCRVTMCFGIFLAQLYSQYAYHDDWTNKHWVGISLYSIWTFTALAFQINNRQISNKNKTK